MACDVCEAEIPAGAGFCPSCGSAVRASCPKCGAAIEPDHRFCPACGHHLVAQAAEERKLVTAVFVDLVGSTRLGERLDPEVLRLVLSRYFEEMTEIIHTWGGSVAKYVGDAILAIFGLPRSHGDDADRALHAALSMADRLGTLNDELESLHGVRLVTRTGINTGEVVTSAVDEVVLGDVMNTAARLEQAAEPRTILVGARTVANLVTRFRIEPVPDVPAKGKTDPVRAYRLLGGVISARRRPAIDLIGRDRQLGLMTTHLDQVIDTGAPFLVTVVGDPGIGKSALVGRFSEQCDANGVTVLQGGCLPYGEGIASWPLREILGNLAGIELNDDSATAAAKFRRFVEHHSDDNEVLDALAMGAGIAIEENHLARAPADVVRRALSHAWPHLLSALARAGPVLLVIEDAHWADDELIRMLDRIVLRTSGPVMVLCTARPDFDEKHSLGTRTPRARITIGPLSHEDQLHFAARLLPGLTPADVETLISVAGGNPFFMEEMVAHMLDSGVLREVDGVFHRVRDAVDEIVPDTIRALLGARIDALEREPREILLAASVIGTSFWVEALAGMVDATDLDGSLDVLEAEGHIVPDREGRLPGERHLAFRHDLVREVAYGSVTRARAARYHAYVADWIEGRIGDRTPEFIDLIAHHRALAAEGASLGWPDDRPTREAVNSSAIDDLLGAASSALRRSAWDDAFRFIERAERLTQSVEARGRVRLERARTRRAVDRYSEAWQDYTGLVEFAESEGLEQLRTDAVIEGALMAGQMGGAIADVHDWRQWLEAMVEKRLATALDTGAVEEAAALLMAKSSLFFWQVEGETADGSLAAATRAVDLAESCGSDRVLAPAMDLFAGVTMMTRGLGAALAVVDRVLTVAEAAPDRVVANELYTTAQWTLAAAGEIDRARLVGDRHLAEANLLGTHTRVHSHRGVVELALARGDLTSVIETTARLRDLIEEDGGRVCDHGAVALSARALALTEAGDEDGIALFDEVEARAVARVQFTAHIGNLERRRPFLPIGVADAALQGFDEARYISQIVARSWVAVPLTVRLHDPDRIDEEISAASQLAAETADPSLQALADWARAVKNSMAGSTHAVEAVWQTLERLERLGRGYTARRLGVDACHLLPSPPPWAEQLARSLEAGGAFRSAGELRSLIEGATPH